MEARAQPTIATFEEIYEEHVDRIWHFVERLGVPDRLIDDAVQDTFVIAHRQLSAFRGASSIGTWLHGIALRVSKDYRVREQRRGAWAELSPALSDEGGTPFERTANREEVQLVLTLLDQLDAVQREVFVLTEFEGFTSAEVAEMTSTNLNTVSSRLRAARRRFDQLVNSVRGVP